MGHKKTKTATKAPEAVGLPSVIVPEKLTLVHEQAESARRDNALITVMTTRAEAKLQLKLKACKDQEILLRKQNQEARTKAAEVLKAAADVDTSEMKTAATALVKALKVRKVKFRANPSMPVLVQGKVSKKYSLSFSCDEDNADRRSTHGDFSFSRTYSFKTPAEVVTLLLEAHRTHEEATRIEAEALVWKKRLARLPQYERTCRARVDEEYLQSTEEGQSSLAKLESEMENDILCLPVI